MTHTSPVPEVAKQLGVPVWQFRNFIKLGIFETTKDASGHVCASLEESRWALNWYDAFLSYLPDLKAKQRSNVARVLLLDYREYIRGTGGQLFVATNNTCKPKSPSWWLYVKSAVLGIFAGVGAGFLFVYLVRFVFDQN